MKNTNHINRIAVAILVSALALMLAISCNKMESYEGTESYPSAPFTLSATEIRCRDTGKAFEWTISKDGKTDSVDEEIDDMYTTAVNILTINVKGSGAYKGVNVRSTNTAAVVVREGDQKDSWVLDYVGDGEADIEVWNGSKKDMQKTTFHVFSKKVIDLEAVVFLWFNKDEKWEEVKVKDFFNNFEDLRENGYRKMGDGHITLPDGAIGRDVPEKWKEWNNPEIPVHEVRFLRVEPENTSYRKIKWDAKRAEENLTKWIEFLDDQGYEYHWFESYEGDVSDLEKNFYITYNYLNNYKWTREYKLNNVFHWSGIALMSFQIELVETNNKTYAFANHFTALIARNEDGWKI